ncbi:MAG: polyhydroxyalkanoate synthesis repressor PhaR [Gammaproteobacteria bacterium]
MTEQRIIKKYPNRRLYDTAISSYITLEDVKRLVLEQTAIKVIDARTQHDITHNTLLQIIMEQEEQGPPLFTNDILQQMIRFYGGAVPNLFKQMFEQSVSLFNNCFSQETKDSGNPSSIMADMAQRNLGTWQSFQEQWMKNFQGMMFSLKEEQATTTVSDTETMKAEAPK